MSYFDRWADDILDRYERGELDDRQYNAEMREMAEAERALQAEDAAAIRQLGCEP